MTTPMGSVWSSHLGRVPYRFPSLAIQKVPSGATALGVDGSFVNASEARAPTRDGNGHISGAS
jgi:hypothetical protein